MVNRFTISVKPCDYRSADLVVYPNENGQWIKFYDYEKLLSRVKELEADRHEYVVKLDALREQIHEQAVAGREDGKLIAELKEDSRRSDALRVAEVSAARAAQKAAETALASARNAILNWYQALPEVRDDVEEALRAIARTLLTSRPSPAPVADTTDATCVDWAKHWGEVAEGKRHPWHENACAPVAAPSVVIPTENQAWAVLDRFFGSHENDAENRSDDAHVEAYAAYRVIAESRDLAVAPVAAPCAGCAAARELLTQYPEKQCDFDAWREQRNAWLEEYP